MIDGFGWFKPADYRRSWLFFDRVHYIFPVLTQGPLQFPENLSQNPLFTLVKPASTAETLDYLVEQSRQDAGDPHFSKLVKLLIPKADLEYAALMIYSDSELKSRLDASMMDSVFAIAYLLNKLLIYSSLTGAVPIFGRTYATDIVIYKIKKWSQFFARQKTAAVVSPSQMTTIAAIAAGLSLGFVADEDLIKVPTPDLVSFKQRSFTLLQQHQSHIIDTSKTFERLPMGSDFQARLADLRKQAKQRRIELDSELRESWLVSGLGKATTVLMTATSLLATAIGLTKFGNASLVLDLSAILSRAGISIGMTSGMPSISKDAPASTRGMLYILEAQKYLSSNVDAVQDRGGELSELAVTLPGADVDLPAVCPPTVASLRRLLLSIITTDTDLISFCQDYFIDVEMEFGNNMDRQTKINILFQMKRPEEILESLQQFAPEAVRARQGELEY